MTVRGANYEKIAGDAYDTPPYVVEDFLDHCGNWFLYKKLMDPCPGKGNMLRAFRKKKYEVVPVKKGRDFLAADLLYPVDDRCFDVVTNPPYGVQGKLAVDFIDKALDLVEPWAGRVAMLLPFDFDAAKTRRRLFVHPAFRSKVVIPYRIAWFDGKPGSTNHAWFFWDWTNRTDPTIEYMYKEEKR